MAILDPDSLHVVLRFTYHGCKVELDARQENSQTFYVVWVHHPQGCAIATTPAPSKAIAIRQGKDWVENHLSIS